MYAFQRTVSCSTHWVKLKDFVNVCFKVFFHKVYWITFRNEENGNVIFLTLLSCLRLIANLIPSSVGIQDSIFYVKLFNLLIKQLEYYILGLCISMQLHFPYVMGFFLVKKVQTYLFLFVIAISQVFKIALSNLFCALFLPIALLPVDLGTNCIQCFYVL